MKGTIMQKNHEIIKKLIDEKEYLEKIIINAEKRISKAPEGTLRISSHNGGIQFYNRLDPSDPSGKYIPSSKKKTAYALAQKKYDLHLIKTANEQLKAINSFLSKYDADALENVYLTSGEKMKPIITPAILSDEEYAAAWLAQEYNKKGFALGTPEHYTQKGERVRSKSEVMIANELSTAGLPYLYELPFKVEGGVLHPDFSVLRISDRQVVRWEHIGLMDYEEYRNEVIERLRKYASRGVVIGNGLIITIETALHPLNIEDIRAVIKYNFIQ